MNLTVEGFTAMILLALILPMLLLWVRRDIEDYRRFKLVEGLERLRYYRRWVIAGFVAFTLSSLCALLLLSRADAVFLMPAEFANLVERDSRTGAALASGEAATGFVTGMLLAAGFGAVLGAVLWSRLRIEPAKLVGDLEAMLPRNGAERFWALLLSINAGVGEELMFRLLLPLLLVLVGLPAWPAFALAAVLFGLVHWYQGWRGVLVTGLFGAGMTMLYLSTGQLWIAMLLHALMDVNGLVLRPLIGSLLRQRRAPGRGRDPAR